MRKGVVAVLVLGLLVALSVSAFAGEGFGRNAQEGSMGLGQGVTRPYIAEALDMDEEALRDARREGKSMIGVAESRGVSADELVDSVVDFRREQMALMVEEGRVTAEHAEQCEEIMETRIRENLERVPEPRGGQMEQRQMMQGKR
ncbi:hypothetical protein [Dethiobacter alkaliphilus]|uniref:DUF2680 domain-containing protein n=1 Tax=Dethiobacter alkaliphilus AHT 1 TaxID=555088 RepID=C0GEF3_DETAL|nr:hypothetical protein [Dethiobacter alkaliphilus]EEG78447.1 conserved hypothetical protein [Dethiobacter alkaliphilus AHT 1]